LYLSGHSPYDTIVIEVDYQERAEPSSDALELLEKRVKSYSGKEVIVVMAQDIPNDEVPDEINKNEGRQFVDLMRRRHQGSDMNITFGGVAEKETMKVRLDLPQDPYHWSESIWMYPIPDRILSHGRSESYVWEYNFSQTIQTQDVRLHYIVHTDFYKKTLDLAVYAAIFLGVLSVSLGVLSVWIAERVRAKKSPEGVVEEREEK